MSIRITKLTAMSALAASVAFAACSKSDNTTATTDSTATGTAAGSTAARTDSTASATTGTTVGTSASPDSAKTNADIFATLHEANAGEIAEGKLAESKGTSAAVKAFGRKMVTDHTQLDEQGRALAKKLNITPALMDSSIVKDAQNDLKDLQSAKAGKDWDQSYLDKQVNGHQKVLDYINKSMNNTNNADIKQMLQQAQPKVQAHLDSAKALKDKVKA